MTKEQVIAGLLGMTVVSAVYFGNMLLSGNWYSPTFTYTFLLVLGFGVGMNAVRHRRQ